MEPMKQIVKEKHYAVTKSGNCISLNSGGSFYIPLVGDCYSSGPTIAEITTAYQNGYLLGPTYMRAETIAYTITVKSWKK